MYIKFSKVFITGFKSIDHAEVNLDDCGIVKVKGINLSEDKTKSNGSGKSSIFEAIIWALYGKTSKGLSNPTNKYTDTGCNVKLIFSIDDVEYTVERFVGNGNGLNLWKSNSDNDLENISGRNKTDTDKILQKIIGINQDIFLSIIFLSQGYNNRISSLGPSARKSRIETITDISEKVEHFKTILNNKKTVFSEKERNLTVELSSISGELSAIERSISRNEDILKSHENDEQVDQSEVDALETKINEIDSKINQLRDRISQIENNLQSLRMTVVSKNSKITQYRDAIAQRTESFNQIKKSICPTCGATLEDNKRKSMESDAQSFINECNSSMKQLQDEINSTSSSIRSLQNKVDAFNKKLSELRNLESKYKSRYSYLIQMNSFDKSIYESQITADKASKIDLIERQKNLGDDKSVVDENIGILDNCLRIVTKQFRDYLLSKIIQFMNDRLKEYSDVLFSNENFNIHITDSFDIYVGDFEYGSLSGGEARKTDLALSLAQRDLALNISGITSNIFILDEILDTLDETATLSALELITSISTEISSLFIISHNNYEIAYDSEIVIEKKDNISNLILAN